MIRVIACAAIASWLFLSGSPAIGQPLDRGPISIHPGFATGNYYRSQVTPARQTYLMGTVDGFMLAPVVGGNRTELAWLETCLKGYVPAQLVAVVDKWLEENPQRWNEQMNALAFAALLSACQAK